jgi:phosphoglycerate dehydrogenase-like enzyme
LSAERLVAISYPVDGDYARVNAEVLADDATIVSTFELDDEQRTAAIRRADAVISWEVAKEIPPGVLAVAPPPRLLQLLSAGVDAVDFAAMPAGLLVAGNAGAYSGPMAEYVLAMTLSLAKGLPEKHAAMAAGRFDKWVPAQVLDGCTCAILGFGGIGTATARLMKAFGVRIQAVTRASTQADLDEALAAADIVVVCLPLNLATRSLIGARELGLMKPDAILVNVARAAIVDQEALYQHLRANPQFRVGLDTWWHEPAGDEPFRTDYPFFDLPNVLGSPHSSSIVAGTMLTGARAAAENVRRYLRGQPITGLVRRADYA